MHCGAGGGFAAALVETAVGWINMMIEAADTDTMISALKADDAAISNVDPELAMEYVEPQADWG